MAGSSVPQRPRTASRGCCRVKPARLMWWGAGPWCSGTSALLPLAVAEHAAGPWPCSKQASHICPLSATGLARGSCLPKAKNPQGALRKGPSWLKYMENYLKYYGCKLINCLLSFANSKQNTPLAACSEKAPLCAFLLFPTTSGFVTGAEKKTPDLEPSSSENLQKAQRWALTTRNSSPGKLPWDLTPHLHALPFPKQQKPVVNCFVTHVLVSRLRIIQHYSLILNDE